MKRIILTTALALAVAAPAFANDQLARSLGIEPGAFTTAELATIKGLRDAGVSKDRETADVFAGLFSRGVVSTQSVGISAGHAQIATNLGLDPNVYSLAEVATIKGLRDAGVSKDRETADVFAGLFSRGVVSTQSVGISAGHAQIAANLGLDPNVYSLAELATIKGHAELVKDNDG